MAESWEDAYNRSKSGIYDSAKTYLASAKDEKKALKRQYKSSVKALKTAYKANAKNMETEYNKNSEDLTKTRDTSIRDAYISKEQNQRQLPALMAAQGLSGGASETALSALMRSYQGARNSAEESFGTNRANLMNQYAANKASMANTYGSNISDVANNYASNIASLKSSYADKMANLQANERTLELQRAQLLYQIEQDRLAREAAAAAQGASYGGGSSGGGGSYAETSANPQVGSNAYVKQNYGTENYGVGMGITQRAAAGANPFRGQDKSSGSGGYSNTYLRNKYGY